MGVGKTGTGEGADGLHVPRLRGPLGAPRNFYDVLARTVVLKRAHAPAFNDATPAQTVSAIFAGWTLCGWRHGDPDATRHVYLLRRGSIWFGFGFFAESTTPPPPSTPDSGAMVDYLRLLRTHQPKQAWHGLDGAGRLERVRSALTAASLDASIGARSAVDFLEVALSRRGGLMARHPQPNHVAYMADILLHDTIEDDPNGSLAVARTMAGLGRYTSLTVVRDQS